MARCVDPREVKWGLNLLSILTDALQKRNSLALAFLFVIDLKMLGFFLLTPVIAGSKAIAHAVRLRQISSKSAWFLSSAKRLI